MQNSFGYALHQLVFILDRKSDEALHSRLGIGYSQLKILMAAKHHSGLKQNEIASYLGQTEASVSRQIKLMKAEGLLLVQIDPANRRSRSILLTDKGTALGKECVTVLEQTHAATFGALSFLEQKMMQELLERLTIKACKDK
ncbi:MAG: MarR family transcriptional regulator [bacterium]